MADKFIFGNWKMSQSLEDGLSFVRGWDLSIPEHVKVSLFPTSLHLQALQKEISTRGLEMAVGAQDCSEYEAGAHTGEVSAKMVAELKASYQLLGHSECRARGQSDELIQEKLKRVMETDLTPVLCIGESKEERQGAKIFDKLERQIQVLVEIDRPFLIAYEPIWAIGTGLTPTVMEIQEVHDYLWKKVPELAKAGKLEGVLYGGSVKPENVKEILAAQGVDGLLIGGASLKLESLKKIVEIATES